MLRNRITALETAEMAYLQLAGLLRERAKELACIYAVDQIGFRMVVLDTKTRSLKHSVPVGRYPFGICLSPDEKKVYVANVGMFEYGWIKESKDEEKTNDKKPLVRNSKQSLSSGKKLKSHAK